MMAGDFRAFIAAYELRRLPIVDGLRRLLRQPTPPTTEIGTADRGLRPGSGFEGELGWDRGAIILAVAEDAVAGGIEKERASQRLGAEHAVLQREPHPLAGFDIHIGPFDRLRESTGLT